MEYANNLGKAVYLPVINRARWRADTMYFQHYTPAETVLKPNRFGIFEPVHHPETPIQLHNLNLILVPLVGFNQSCDRIGMGGGYYDRTLAKQGIRNTRFVGLAFACQQVEFEPMPHDVRLHAIITEEGIIYH